MKPYWKSISFWHNLLTLIVGVLTVLADQTWLTAEQKMAVLSIIAILKPILDQLIRFVTVEPVTAPKPLKGIQEKRLHKGN